MRYLFLAYSDEQWETLPAKERERFDEACRANIELLQESGYLLAALDLRRDTAVTIQIHHDTVLLTDGHRAAAEELVALYFIDARDLNEAVLLASRMPQIKYGPISISSPSV